MAIAQQIAAALVAQGRTNVSQEELETLINAVVGMAEASKNSDKPVTTADFVKGLTAGNTNPSPAPPVQPVPPPPIPITAASAAKLTNVPGLSTPASVANVKDALNSITESLRSKTPEVIKPLDQAVKMESLSDNDLKSLLQNFKDLSTDEQHGLINFLKKLEATDSARVEKLRAYVNLGSSSASPALKPISPESDNDELLRPARSTSPFSMRKGTHNPCDDEDQWKPKLDMFAEEEEEDKRKRFDEKPKKLVLSDDDDDDYSYEDIYKAADKNVLENERAKKRSYSRSRSKSPKSWSRSESRSPNLKKSTDYPKNSDPNAILNETKKLIANIMGDLPNKFVTKSHISSMSENSPLSGQGLSSSLIPPSTAPSMPQNSYPNFNMNPAPPNNQQMSYPSNQYQNYGMVPPPQPPQPPPSYDSELPMNPITATLLILPTFI
ncbi:unnamed protein product [Trichogramma brassicae]|uniref:Uncharacterized protein n=1 Tax=Trichogramma brassicae TaxID=86971 RepID=A0A6H5IWR2_9HYME|nr:unnamed protein product [Trichogramma brassicae]